MRRAGVLKAAAPRLAISMRYTVSVGKTQSVSNEIVPARLSFVPSRSMYRLGGDFGTSLMHDRRAEI